MPAAATAQPRQRLALALLLIAGAAVAVATLPVTDVLLSAIALIHDAGPLGAVAFVAIYALSTVLMLPGSVLTLAAGLLYGPLVGFLIVWFASNLGATGAFLLGRGWLRGTVSGWVGERPMFAALDRAMGDEGLKLVVLIRLSPLFPFNLVNYGLGLTQVRLRDYVLGSVLGMAPATFLYVYLGSTLSEVSQVLDGAPNSSGSRWFFWLGLLATVLVTTFIGRAAKRALTQALDTAA